MAAEIKNLEAGKFLSENTVYQSGIGAVVNSMKAHEAIIISYNEAISDCIKMLNATTDKTREFLIEELIKLKK